MRARAFFLLAVVVPGAVASALISSSCAQTPTNVPIRTFERAQRMDLICMQVTTPSVEDPTVLVQIPPKPLPQSACPPVPAGIDGNISLQNHLFALVTQTARGEVATVDLTGGGVVDPDRATPGINFLPVGQIPTDIASTPDGTATFVAAAEVNKPAIYMLPSTQILGDWCVPGQNVPCLPQDLLPPPLSLTEWPVCSLPQAPGAITIVPRTGSSAIADGGSGEAGAAEGAGYEVVVVLPGDRLNTAKVITIDPLPMLRGAKLDSSPGPTIAPGSLQPCSILGAVEVSGPQQIDVSNAPVGPAWPDGVPYLDASIDTSHLVPPTPGASCAAPTPPPEDAGTIADAGDGGDAEADSGSGNTTVVDAGTLPVPFQDGISPSAADVVRDSTTLFVADSALPIIHVFDISADQPVELEPLLVTSIVAPNRLRTARTLAVSPATRDFKKYLYAVDSNDGSLIVYDVTDLTTSPHVPLIRPHAELNPFIPPDRITFSSPVAAVSFARHDFAALTNIAGAQGAALTGLLCNPNKNADAVSDPGITYRATGIIQTSNTTVTGAALGPYRLRGIFGMVTLSSGLVIPIDVDDWDAPCRRPDPTGLGGGDVGGDAGIATPAPYTLMGEYSPTEPAPTNGSDIDPYHAPFADDSLPVSQPPPPPNPGFASAGEPTTLENFFPVSAPNRMRSFYYLRNDPNTLSRTPNLSGAVQITLNGGSLPLTGPGGQPTPLMIPTSRGDLADPSLLVTPTSSTSGYLPDLQPPSVRIAWDDPTAHIDQDWTVVFEGQIPGFTGISLTISTDDNGSSLLFTQPQALFCARGVEDFAMGQSRVQLVKSEAQPRGINHFVDVAKVTPGPDFPLPPNLSQRVGDYVQITDDILDQTDPYWSDETAAKIDPSLPADALGRYNACATNFGDNSNPTIQRDFPILEAFEDHLRVGRFGYPAGTTPTIATRVIVGPDPGNTPFFNRARYCFHDQVGFAIRTGGEWLASGTVSGYLHHVTADPSTGRCTQSCAGYQALLNSREVMLAKPASLPAVDRNSALAVRNPMFSYFIVDGTTTAADGVTLLDAPPQRDSTWAFSMRGGFVPLSVNIAATTTSVSPQSMKFIDSFQQLAVIDGSSQGLILIDLGTVAFAHDPFF